MTSNTNQNKDQDYFVSTKDEKGDFIIYESEGFRLDEIDFINLIKICLIEKRNMGVGRKLLEVYRDSTQHKKEIADDRLKRIGLPENSKPTTARKFKEK
jgi:hypothetical protein